jgi:hypothetical protein
MKKTLKSAAPTINISLFAPRKLKKAWKTWERKGGAMGLALLNHETSEVIKITGCKSSIELVKTLKKNKVIGLPEIVDFYQSIGTITNSHHNKAHAYLSIFYLEPPHSAQEAIQEFCELMMNSRFEAIQKGTFGKPVTQQDINRHSLISALIYCEENPVLKQLVDAISYLTVFIESVPNVKIDLLDPRDILQDSNGQLILIDPVA